MTKPVPKDWITGISPYVPGKAASDDGRKLAKLSANENPLGTSPKARDAFMAATADPATYPDPAAAAPRSEKRRAGNECVSTFKFWRRQEHKKNKTIHHNKE